MSYPFIHVVCHKHGEQLLINLPSQLCCEESNWCSKLGNLLVARKNVLEIVDANLSASEIEFAKCMMCRTGSFYIVDKQNINKNTKACAAHDECWETVEREHCQLPSMAKLKWLTNL
jgi:hypothetical protein